MWVLAGTVPAGEEARNGRSACATREGDEGAARRAPYLVGPTARGDSCQWELPPPGGAPATLPTGGSQAGQV